MNFFLLMEKTKKKYIKITLTMMTMIMIRRETKGKPGGMRPKLTIVIN